MHNHNFTEFSDLLDSAYDLIGVGTNKTISSGAKAMFFKAMGQYSIEQFRFALSAHCMHRQRGRFTPKPADIIEQLDGLTGGDGRPSEDEAWAIALTSQSEQDTVVWTSEIAEAFAICSPVLNEGDKVGARMAFKDAYSRLTAASRQSGTPAKWVASIGWDADRRDQVLSKAVTAGLLPAPQAAALLPNFSASPNHAAECPEGLKRVKEEMARMNVIRAKQIEAYEAQAENERLAVVARKEELAKQAQELASRVTA